MKIRYLPYLKIMSFVASTSLACCAMSGCGGDTANKKSLIETRNSSPIAYAGADRIVTPGITVRLDGSESSDADGDALTYMWHVISVPTGSKVSLVENNISNPIFIADIDGNYAFELEVSDGIETVSDHVFVTATNEIGTPAGIECDDDYKEFNDIDSSDITSYSEWTCRPVARELHTYDIGAHDVGSFPIPVSFNTLGEQTRSAGVTPAAVQVNRTTSHDGANSPQHYVLNSIKLEHQRELYQL